MHPINLREEAAKVGLFEYKEVGRMNGHSLTLIKATAATLDFHSHPDSDEAFLVVEGEMKLEFEDRIVPLKAGELCIVPKGVRHRPIVETAVTNLLIEQAGTLTAANTLHQP